MKHWLPGASLRGTFGVHVRTWLLPAPPLACEQLTEVGWGAIPQPAWIVSVPGRKLNLVLPGVVQVPPGQSVSDVHANPALVPPAHTRFAHAVFEGSAKPPSLGQSRAYKKVLTVICVAPERVPAVKLSLRVTVSPTKVGVWSVPLGLKVGSMPAPHDFPWARAEGAWPTTSARA